MYHKFPSDIFWGVKNMKTIIFSILPIPQLFVEMFHETSKINNVIIILSSTCNMPTVLQILCKISFKLSKSNEIPKIIKLHLKLQSKHLWGRLFSCTKPKHNIFNLRASHILHTVAKGVSRKNQKLIYNQNYLPRKIRIIKWYLIKRENCFVISNSFWDMI